MPGALGVSGNTPASCVCDALRRKEEENGGTETRGVEREREREKKVFDNQIDD